MKNYNIQALRALAAYAVVCHHIVDSLRNYIAVDRFLWNPVFGSFGVEVFFVISGYIMLSTTSIRPRKPFEFFIERIIRVAPLYWILTLVAFTFIANGFKLFAIHHVSWGHLITSIAFMPYIQNHELLFPVLFVGWTLNYEMMFYTVFSFCLFMPSSFARCFMLITILAILIGLRVLVPNSFTNYAGNQIITGFALGAIIYLCTGKYRRGNILGIAMTLSGIFGLVLTDIYSLNDTVNGAALVSILAATIVAGLVLMEKAGMTIGRGQLSRQGDASYALYLSHPFVIQIIGKIALIYNLNSSTFLLIAITILMFACSIMSGSMLHTYLEKPISCALRKKISRFAFS